MPNRDVSEPFIESAGLNPEAPLNEGRPADSSNYDREGYDEAQRAEIAEVEGDGPNDGVVMTDMRADMGEDLDEDEVENDADTLDAVETDGSERYDEVVDENGDFA